MPCEYDTVSFKICRCSNKWRCECLIPRKKKPAPPFNSGLKRSIKIGLHPKFYTTSLESPAAGHYDPSLPKTKSTAISWKREIDSEEFSATMGGRFLEKYSMERKLRKSGGGPGTHKISQWPENVLKKACKSIRRDVGLGTAPFYHPSYISKIPGPGYTKKDPYYYLEKHRREGLSCLPSFEYDGLRPRFREISKPWSLPCNRYDVKHPDSLEATLNKITGKRGPYDLFTGPRDETTIKGYMARMKEECRGGWPKSLPGEVEKMLHKSNHFKGRWTSCPRFPKKPSTRLMLNDISLCYKDPDHPGPGHYLPKSPRKPSSALNYPFLSNIEFVRPITRTEIRPGPGRYKIKEKKHIKGHGWTWVFKSKAPRTNFIVIQSYNSF